MSRAVCAYASRGETCCLDGQLLVILSYALLTVTESRKLSLCRSWRATHVEVQMLILVELVIITLDPLHVLVKVGNGKNFAVCRSSRASHEQAQMLVLSS
jgi:hypothetical protein